MPLDSFHNFAAYGVAVADVALAVVSLVVEGGEASPVDHRGLMSWCMPLAAMVAAAAAAVGGRRCRRRPRPVHCVSFDP